jgi:hypothetical protein
VTAAERIAVRWAFAVLGAALWLLLNAYLDSKQTETGALQLSAEISNDRAAEHAALKGAR